jgi:hypothetical protein
MASGTKAKATVSPLNKLIFISLKASLRMDFQIPIKRRIVPRKANRLAKGKTSGCSNLCGQPFNVIFWVKRLAARFFI